MPRLEKMKFIDELGTLDSRIANAQATADGARDSTERRAAHATLLRLQEQRNALLKRAGVNEDQAARIQQEIAAIKSQQ